MPQFKQTGVNSKMKKSLLIATFVLITSPAFADGTDRSAEYILNRVFDSSSGALNTSSSATGDVESVGDCSSGDCLDGTSDGGTKVTLYNATANSVISGDTASTNFSQSALRVGPNASVTVGSAGGGVFKVIGVGGSNNEDIRANLETTSNVVDWTSNTSASSWRFGSGNSNFQLVWSENGGASSRFIIRPIDTNETNDSAKITSTVNSASQGSGNIIFAETADASTNFGVPLRTDITTVWQGSDATAVTERGWSQYDSTNNRFVISSETGSLFLGGSGNNGISLDNSTLTSSRTTDLGWALVDQTYNQACNTGCVNACVFGFENATGTAVTNIVSCEATTADLCLCAGPN